MGESEDVQSPWLTLPQAVSYSKRGRTLITEALHRGELRGYQATPAGRWTIHRDDLDAWIRGEIAPVEVPSITRPRRTARDSS